MIAENISSIRRRIAAACARCGRDPGSVTVVAVSKGRDINEIRQALACGLENIGENRVQEALLKHKALEPVFPLAVWHLVGHLQTNKAGDAVRLFDLIHSVDSLKLAKEIDQQAGRIAKTQEILIQVNTAGEKSKYGIEPRTLAALAEEIMPLPNVRVRGLMCLAPASADPGSGRPFFKSLRSLLATSGVQGDVLSMGMSDDFEAAIEEGATMIRLGRAVFGE